MSDPDSPGDAEDGPTPRKDRLVQTRVPRNLETRLKQEARRRRVSVSQFIRNLLEDTFNLVDGVLENVDDIVTESREFASQVRRDAARVAATARRRAGARPDPEREAMRDQVPEEAHDDPDFPDREALSQVHAWNPVILNRSARCSHCGTRIERGEQGYLGFGEEPGRAAAWLCGDCIETL
jgi:hypothetical protein